MHEDAQIYHHLQAFSLINIGCPFLGVWSIYAWISNNILVYKFCRKRGRTGDI